ncbi:purine and uridine phosphorylase [Aspergillus violaceofuscus CBS 115571]|uniref:Purine and uridine phosphorylase n=1 Tax=Aspergillus violaceofuscus (strain CBS 115571) TaxID=1450538 RepID=A0A2V5IWE4_ASPV1|nr:purine and uridine phosphorylase [Aspergillus violaceofuscus CBS 115571]
MERNSVTENFSREDYTVGWICALAPELAAAAAMLDETYAPPAVFQQDPNDSNVYSCGRMGQHKVVIVSLGAGMPGKVPASTTATSLLRSFPKIRFGLMVGIGGGIPAKIAEDSADDIRLGDVVVSVPHVESGGVVQYDHGKIVHEGQFVQTGSLGKAPTILLKAVQRVQAQHDMQGSSIPELLEKILQDRPKMAIKCQRPDAEDCLYQAHRCDARHLVQRPARDSDEPVIHYGLIGSADRVMLHGPTRDYLRTAKNIICLEMDAAGLMDKLSCLVIRGISDYADTHKSDRWHGYASIVAAGYAKELLTVVPEPTREPTAVELMPVSD